MELSEVGSATWVRDGVRKVRGGARPRAPYKSLHRLKFSMQSEVGSHRRGLSRRSDICCTERRCEMWGGKGGRRSRYNKRGGDEHWDGGEAAGGQEGDVPRWYS